MKRFTETAKWEKPWFQDLAPHLKCLWLYMCDKADCAGVWEMNWKAASLFIGKTVTRADLEHFKGRVAEFGEKLVIGSFIDFQYGKLSEECRAHIPIFRTLSKHSLSIGYSKAIHSLKEQEPEKETEQELEKETEAPKVIEPNKARGTAEEFVTFCVELGLPKSDGEWVFDKWNGNGWKNGSESIKCWRSTIRAWKTAGYMASQKGRNGRTGADGIQENLKAKNVFTA
jgi:hypothetical protein